MSPKVLSIFNNAKLFLSSEELRELQACIDNEIGASEKKNTNDCLGEEWKMEAVIARLMNGAMRQRNIQKV
jgi:hypothetical protein